MHVFTEAEVDSGHEFRVVDGLLTNFHLPESTLIMLVSALAGRERVLEAYRHAVEARYRLVDAERRRDAVLRSLGVWLDKHFPGSHSWTLMLLIIGLAIGCLNAWHWVAREDKTMRDEQEDGDE